MDALRKPLLLLLLLHRPVWLALCFAGWWGDAHWALLRAGGLLAALGTDEANGLVPEIPFAARTSGLVFDLERVLPMADLLSAWAFMAATVRAVLYRREFHAEVLRALRDGPDPVLPRPPR